MNYNHLSLEERHYINKSIKNSISLNKIAKDLDRSQSTISREVNRNTGSRGYRYKQANEIAIHRQNNKPKHLKLTDSLIEKINQLVINDLSPEQVIGRLKKEEKIDLHFETIYRHIKRDKNIGGTLYLHLRHQNKTYRKRYGSGKRHPAIPDRVDIDKRPKIADERRRVGDWEGDTIIGKNHKGAIATLDERKTKLRLAFPVNYKTTELVVTAMEGLLDPIKNWVKTITLDNGKEFCLHKRMADNLDCKTYFAKPYHSWERGQNENANGLLRQYFPKSMELKDIAKERVIEAIDKLNSRPRKCLGYNTPYEEFEKATGITRDQLLAYALKM